LAQYLEANTPVAGDVWTLVYSDNAGGSWEARSVRFDFFSHDPGDPASCERKLDACGPDLRNHRGRQSVRQWRQRRHRCSRSNDFVSGGDGNDTITGGPGNDILNGGNGTDMFVWLNGDQGVVGSQRHDAVQTFQAGDLLNLQDLLRTARIFRITSMSPLTAPT
jgi:hypothetical protein